MGWFSRRPGTEQTPAKQKSDDLIDAKIDAIRKDTVEKFDKFTESFNELNKELEKRGDTAYNVFMATPASRNYRNKQ